jgi:hypothetical protein
VPERRKDRHLRRLGKLRSRFDTSIEDAPTVRIGCTGTPSGTVAIYDHAYLASLGLSGWADKSKKEGELRVSLGPQPSRCRSFGMRRIRGHPQILQVRGTAKIVKVA